MHPARIALTIVALGAGAVFVASVGRWTRWDQLLRVVVAAAAAGAAFGGMRGEPVRVAGEAALLAIGAAAFQLSIGPGPPRVAAKLASDRVCLRLAAVSWIVSWGAWILWGFDVVNRLRGGPAVVGTLAATGAGALAWAGARLRR